MPKRNADHKISKYKAKIRKLQLSEQMRRRRIIVSSSESSEENFEIRTTHDARPPTPLIAQAEPALPAPDGEIISQSPPPMALPACDDPLSPTMLLAAAGEDAQEPKELPPEVDPLLLEALGETSEEIAVYGPSIHDKLAQRWLPILKTGLQTEVKEKLLKEYAAPENCKLLKAPTLNPEIVAALNDFSKGRDKKIQVKQDQLGLGLTCINRAMSILLVSDDKINAMRFLSDGCRILTDLHYMETQSRAKLITPGLDKSILTILQDHIRDETLFGNTLPEKIKASKAIEKQGQQIKKPTPKPSTSSAPTTPSPRPRGNWAGPPRYQNTSARGGRTAQHRSQYRRGLAPAQATAAPLPPPRHPPSTSVSSKRAAHQ